VPTLPPSFTILAFATGMYLLAILAPRLFRLATFRRAGRSSPASNAIEPTSAGQG
jgi:hypothetical protein